MFLTKKFCCGRLCCHHRPAVPNPNYCELLPNAQQLQLQTRRRSPAASRPAPHTVCRVCCRSGEQTAPLGFSTTQKSGEPQVGCKAERAPGTASSLPLLPAPSPRGPRLGIQAAHSGRCSPAPAPPLTEGYFLKTNPLSPAPCPARRPQPCREPGSGYSGVSAEQRAREAPTRPLPAPARDRTGPLCRGAASTRARGPQNGRDGAAVPRGLRRPGPPRHRRSPPIPLGSAALTLQAWGSSASGCRRRSGDPGSSAPSSAAATTDLSERLKMAPRTRRLL